METKSKFHHRQFIRLKPEVLVSFMYIVQIKGIQMKSKHKPVLIDDISPGGVKFTTDLSLPVGEQVILGFHLHILNQWITLEGCVVWSRKFENLYEYGVKLRLDPAERIHLIKLLNDLLLYLCPVNARVHQIYGSISKHYLTHPIINCSL